MQPMLRCTIRAMRRSTSLSFAALAYVLPLTASAETIEVTPTDDYSVIESAQPGDEVVIAPGTYQYRVNFETSGTESEPIRIRAQDPSNPPVWNLSGQAIRDWPGSYGGGDNGRGCWQVRGDHYIISDIVFEECRDHGGAGLRAVNVQDLRVSNCVFSNSTNGLTGVADPFVIEFSEFVGNGRPYEDGDNPAHHLYIFGGSVELRYNVFHDAEAGQNFHVRARDAIIEYNWFATPGSYMGDVMSCEHFCGGTGHNGITQRMLLRGNVILQGNPNNNSQIIALFNDEGGSNDDTGAVETMELTMIHNTVIGTDVGDGHTQNLVNMRNDTVDTHVVLDNNAIYNVKDVAQPRDEGLSNWSIAGTNNWISTGTAASELSASVEGDDPGFVDPSAGDYRPATGSSLIGAAGPSSADAPSQEYFENGSNARMYRPRASTSDIGAFEHDTSGTGVGPGEGSGGTGGSSSGGTGGSSTGGSAGSAGGTAASSSDDDNGCGCRFGNTGHSGLAGLLLLSLLGAVRRRG